MNHALLYRFLAIAGCIGLMVFLGLSYGNAGWLFALPLLAPLPGLLLKHRYTYAWASMLIIFYLGWFLSEVAAPQTLTWPVHAALVSALSSFLGCVMYVRVTRGRPASD